MFAILELSYINRFLRKKKALVFELPFFQDHPTTLKGWAFSFVSSVIKRNLSKVHRVTPDSNAFVSLEDELRNVA